MKKKYPIRILNLFKNVPLHLSMPDKNIEQKYNDVIKKIRSQKAISKSMSHINKNPGTPKIIRRKTNASGGFKKFKSFFN